MGLLHDARLAALYARDIVGLNPLLEALGDRGMPMDQDQRHRVALALSEERRHIADQMTAAVPAAARPTRLWKRPYPGAEEQQAQATIWVCTACGQTRVPATHPCLKGGHVRERRSITVPVWVESLPFTPSNVQMKRYARFKGYKLPVRDGRETADETAVRHLALRHETDPVLPLVLRYRELDKLVSTYVGDPHTES